MIRNFRCYDLAVQFYRTAGRLNLPRHLKEQLLRAASSIVLNLAEGDGRQTAADRRRFLTSHMEAFANVSRYWILSLMRPLHSKPTSLFRLIQNTRA